MTAAQDRDALLEAVQKGIDAASSNSAKWKPLKDWFLERFGEANIPDKRSAEGKYVTADNQVWNRIHNELAGIDPKYVVITAASPALIPSIQNHLAKTQYPRARAFLLLNGLDPVQLQVFQPDEVTVQIEAMFPEVTTDYIDRPEHKANNSDGASAYPRTLEMTSLSIDERVLRMVVLSIRSSNAVILVGPPGTGKTTLLRQVVARIQNDPAPYGFLTVGEPLIATPEESWTTMDLLGGRTLDENGELRFRPGLVLKAIAGDNWLILDEANRADLDRIFGGLLTWLTGEVEVDLGPVSSHVAADRVTLGWSGDGQSRVENEASLDANKPTGKPVRYLAGDQWRLLGTYNAADAQRVFRWGQALGRRFARVPIPAPDPAGFAEVVAPLTVDLPAVVHRGVVDLYTAHWELHEAKSGPALFVHLPRYVQQGLIGSVGTDQLALDLLAEAYLINLGTRLSKLRTDDLDLLRDDIVNSRKVFTDEQWSWIAEHIEILG